SLANNPGIYGPGATLANLDQRRILRGFGANRILSTLANSNYNGLQVEVTKRFSRGFSLQGAYAFGKAMDMSAATAAGLGTAPRDVFNLSDEMSLSSTHAKHVANVSWIWDVPSPHIHPVLDRVVGGWQVNGLVSLRSGTPFNVLTGADNALSGSSNQRPNVVG